MATPCRRPTPCRPPPAAIAELDAQDVGYVRPDGSFFLMADVTAAGLPTWEFCTRLLAEVVDCEPEDLGIGMPVTVDFQRIDDDLTLPVWRRT